MKKKIFINKPNKIIIISFLALAVIGVIYMCSNMYIKDNRVYEVNQDKNQDEIRKIDGQVSTKGKNSFTKLNFHIKNDKFPITVSKDKKYIFYVKPFKDSEKVTNIVSGNIPLKVNLIIYDVENNKEFILKKDIPLITACKWNNEGNMVAFCGGEKIYIYNMDKKTFLFQNETKADYVTYFGWSPDGKRLYTEHSNLPNNTIYYVDSKEKIESYNSHENKYYKGNIDKNYYYVTTNEIVNSTSQRVSTLVVDSNGQKIKKLFSGKFRDAYGISSLLIGENDFGLYYINNINDSFEPLLISNEYIYDVKFIYNEGFVYTIKNRVNDGNNQNNFVMVVVNNKGKEVKRFIVSGGNFSLSPDGKKALVSGRRGEIIDFENNSLEYSTKFKYEDKEEVFKTIRGAAEVIAKYMCSGKYNINETKKYFSNNEKSNQYALLDLKNIYKDKNEIIPTVISNKYDIYIEADDCKIINKSIAYVKVHGILRNSGGSINNLSLELELNYNSKENKWYIVGLSNFSYTDEYKKVENTCNEYIVKAKQGKLFNGLFKNKDLDLLQIQFWDISKPGLALNLKQSNYCKVYIKVKEGKNSSLYKLILHKDIKNNWEISELKKDRLSYLY